VQSARSGEGNSNYTVMFRINGAPVMARGGNMIPMETLEGRYQPGMHRRLVQSAAEGGMNMMRVWGGGIYPYQEWFDACDDFGIMVFQVCVLCMPSTVSVKALSSSHVAIASRVSSRPARQLVFSLSVCMNTRQASPHASPVRLSTHACKYACTQHHTYVHTLTHARAPPIHVHRT